MCQESLIFDIEALDALVGTLLDRYGSDRDDPLVEAALAVRSEKLRQLLAGRERVARPSRGERGRHLRLVAEDGRLVA